MSPPKLRKSKIRTAFKLAEHENCFAMSANKKPFLCIAKDETGFGLATFFVLGAGLVFKYAERDPFFRQCNRVRGRAKGGSQMRTSLCGSVDIY